MVKLFVTGTCVLLAFTARRNGRQCCSNRPEDGYAEDCAREGNPEKVGPRRGSEIANAVEDAEDVGGGRWSNKGGEIK